MDSEVEEEYVCNFFCSCACYVFGVHIKIV